MKTNLFEVIQALNKRFNLELELPNRNFELTKALVIEKRSEERKLISNCVILLKIDPLLLEKETFENCLVIHDYFNWSFGDSFSLYNSHPLYLFDYLISNGYANEPFGIDEMQMIRWETPKNTVERTILGYKVNDSKSSFIIGPGARVGISGDICYHDDDFIARQATSIGGVKIGKNVIIGANVVIYRGYTDLTEIADNTIIGANSIIYGGSKVKGFLLPNTIYE